MLDEFFSIESLEFSVPSEILPSNEESKNQNESKDKPINTVFNISESNDDYFEDIRYRLTNRSYDIIESKKDGLNKLRGKKIDNKNFDEK